VIPSGFAAALASRPDRHRRPHQRAPALRRLHQERAPGPPHRHRVRDDIGLSAARARRTMELLKQDPELVSARAEHEGRGYVTSGRRGQRGLRPGRHLVRAGGGGVRRGRCRWTTTREWTSSPSHRELTPQSPYALNVMRITVDGQPMDDPGRSSSDVQRCTDVALEGAKIQFRFDDLESRPRLGVAGASRSLRRRRDGALPHLRQLRGLLDHVRDPRLRARQSLQAAAWPFAPVDKRAGWRSGSPRDRGEPRSSSYVLRAYDAKGHFDETSAGRCGCAPRSARPAPTLRAPRHLRRERPGPATPSPSRAAR
jgi:hypothetical protein